MPSPINLKALAAACLLTGCLGSIHGFSVFIVPLERALGSDRASISLIYSLALLSLTLAVLLGHHLYRRCPPALLAAGAGIGAAAGLALAAVGASLAAFYLGYSVLFGAANGVGYGFALALAGLSGGAHRGLAMGTVTAAYALGATVFAQIFSVLIAWSGVATCLGAMAALMAAVALVSALLLPGGAGPFAALPAGRRPGLGALGPAGLLARLWLGYGLGVSAGLMAIGHAAGIVLAAGGRQDAAVTGAMLIGCGNALGGFAAGWLADRWSARALLVGLPLLSAATLVGLSTISGAAPVIAGLAVIGFVYGAVIVAYPAAIADQFGAADFARAYGRVFTAWGVAGLAAPWLAGALFDASGSYATALLVAGAAAIHSAATAALLPRGATQAAPEG